MLSLHAIVEMQDQLLLHLIDSCLCHSTTIMARVGNHILKHKDNSEYVAMSDDCLVSNDLTFLQSMQHIMHYKCMHQNVDDCLSLLQKILTQAVKYLIFFSYDKKILASTNYILELIRCYVSMIGYMYSGVRTVMDMDIAAVARYLSYDFISILTTTDDDGNDDSGGRGMSINEIFTHITKIKPIDCNTFNEIFTHCLKDL